MRKKIFKLFSFFNFILIAFLQPFLVFSAYFVDDGSGDQTLVGSAPGAVSSKKQGLPYVELVFDKGNPKVGEYINATAYLDGLFDTYKEDEAYFTWYLKRKNCGLDDSPSDLKKDKCDLDGNGKITTNDWKIEAARIVAKGGYDNSKTTYENESDDGDDDGYEAVPPVTGSKSWDGDNGDAADSCYVTDYESGLIYELNDFETKWGTSDGGADCSSGTHRACIDDATSNCDNPNTLPVESEQKDFCQELSNNNDVYCTVTKDVNGLVMPDSYTASSYCPDGSKAVCLNDTGTTSDVVDLVTVKILPKSDFCKYFYDDPGPPLVPAINDDPCHESRETSSLSNPQCYFERSHNSCKHLFPDARISGEETGDGDFKATEEDFWGTNPKESSTAKNGNKDEANVMGLGVKEFKWKYQEGDKVGVVVESLTLIPTPHNDSSYMRMWGFSKNVCEAISDEIDRNKDTDQGIIGFYSENANDTENRILMTKFDINDCLEENLVDPADQGVSGNVINADLGFTYNPENPLNDPTGDLTVPRGDLFAVTAGWFDQEVTNTRSYLYEWTIETQIDEATDDTDGVWRDITEDYWDNNEFVHQGYGLNRLEFPLAINNEFFCPKGMSENACESRNKNKNVQKIKLKLKITVDNDGDVSIKEGELIVNVNNLINDLVVYNAAIDSEGKLDLGSVICNNPEERISCPVFENDIIGLSLADENESLSSVTWSINGNKLSCSKDISTSCATSDKVVFFPTIKPEGSEIIEIKVSATNTDNGQPFNMTKYFNVINLNEGVGVKLVSLDFVSAWPRQVGTRIDLSGNRFPEFSESAFETYPGNNVSLRFNLSPAWLGSQAQINSKVVGLEEVGFQGKDILFKTEGSVGDSYQIYYDISYIQSREKIAALASIWGISAAQAFSLDRQGSATVDLLLDPETVTPETYPGVWGANLISKLGTNTMFLIKIGLSAFVIVLLFWLPQALILGRLKRN